MDGSIALTVSGGTPAYSYNWSPVSGSASSIDNLSSGTYTYTVTDNHGCTSSGSVYLPLSSALNIKTSVKQPPCPTLYGNISVAVTGGNPGYTYVWSNSGQNSSIDPDLAPGAYSLTVIDSRGCTQSESFALQYQTLNPSVEAGIDDSINLGGSITLTAVANWNAGNLTYTWSPDYQLSCTECKSTDASPLQTITYIVQAVDTNGCMASDSVTVFVDKTYNLYVPNAFSPNGDGINDYFSVYGDSSSWKYMEVAIFNRWGEKVFQSNDLEFKWDGRFKGVLQEPGVYVYELNLVFIDGHSIGTKKGSITLIR
jgi:gliding motility-associated-like protein